MEIERVGEWLGHPGPTLEGVLLSSFTSTYGIARQGWLGVKVRVVLLDSSQTLCHRQNAGLQVRRLAKRGPAERAGLKIDDVLLSVDGSITNYHGSLQDALASRRADDTIVVRLLRDGRAREVIVDLVEITTH